MADLVMRAEALARTAHAGQCRKGAAAQPYIMHLGEVAALTLRFGGDAVAVAAAWLHDVVEDCPGCGPGDIAAGFGAEAAGVVAGLTDERALPKAERKRLQLVNAAKKSDAAALVKIADKAANVRAIGASPPAGQGNRI